MTEFIGRGWKFPIRVNARGSLSFVEGAQVVEEAIAVLLGTPKNSRVMEPEFGCDLPRFLFAPNNANTRALIGEEVRQSLIRFEPRIDVMSVSVDSAVETANQLFIQVDYRLRSNNTHHNLVYPFYLNE
ncbi:baseplate protein [Alteromonadaceae bacterium M269]|nr:baseplate protein [Alteromonadaceae bacterium M269]